MSMADSIHYGDELIRFTVRYQRARASGRVAIHVEPDGRVIVDAPQGASQAAIRTAVNARGRWIFKHVGDARRRLANVLPREYVSGESLLYLGRRYRLRVTVATDGAAGVRLQGGIIEALVPQRRADVVRRTLIDWYRSRARIVLGDRLESVAADLRWVRQLPPMRLQAMKAQWGSCSPAGRLTLNPGLVRAPRECIDYVLLHELCHLKEHNHSPRFYRLLDAHLPQWRSIKLRLDDLAEIILAS